MLHGATGAATQGGLGCYHGTAAVLPWCGDVAASSHGVATKGALCCYNGAVALLQMADDLAIRFDQPCCKGRPAVLPWRDGVASSGRRRCYWRGAVVLQEGNNVAASVDGEGTSPATWRRFSPTTTMTSEGDARRGEKMLHHFSGEPLTASVATPAAGLFRRRPGQVLRPATPAASTPAGDGSVSREEWGRVKREDVGQRHVLCLFPFLFSLR